MGLVVAAALALSTASRAGPSEFAGRMEFLGAARTWQLLVSNTGTETIRCLRVIAPPGVRFTRVVGPAGTEFTATEFGNRQLAIAPDVTFHQSFTITTTAPFTRTAPPRVYVGDCTAEVQAEVVVRDVTPTADPCTCRRLVAQATPSTRTLSPAARTLDLGLSWSLTCSGGAGGCLGYLAVTRLDVAHTGAAGPRPRLLVTRRALPCRAPCGRTTRKRLTVVVTSSAPVRTLFGRTLVFRVTTRCAFAVRTTMLRISIDAKGRMRAG